MTLGGAILVALAAWINTWLGLVVFLVLVAVAAVGDPRRHATATAAGARRPRRGADAADPRHRERDGRRGRRCSTSSATRRTVSARKCCSCAPPSTRVSAPGRPTRTAPAPRRRIASTRASPGWARQASRREARSATAIHSRRSRTRSAVPGGRDRRLDASAGPIPLARARRRRAGPRAVRRARHARRRGSRAGGSLREAREDSQLTCRRSRTRTSRRRRSAPR